MELFGKSIIERYKSGELNTATFCHEYQRLYADNDDHGKDPLNSSFNNALFDLSVRYEDPTESKVEIEKEINDLLGKIDKRS